MTYGWPGGLSKGDAVILHRPLAKDFLEWLRAYRRAGVKVIVQVDDDSSCIPTTNRWQISPEQLRLHDRAIAEADGLIVTTPRLQKVYSPMARRTWLIRNYLPARLSGPLYQWSGRLPVAIRVGWAGTTECHLHDLQWLAGVADQMLYGATFSHVGDPPDRTVTPAHRALGITGETELFPLELDETHFYKLMSRADVGIVPLEPGLFNTAKSWLKGLEYMTLGIPVVATKVAEYESLITHGVDGFLASTPAKFADYVQQLVWDPVLRQRMAVAAKVRASELTLERNLDGWQEVLSAITVARKKARSREPQDGRNPRRDPVGSAR